MNIVNTLEATVLSPIIIKLAQNDYLDKYLGQVQIWVMSGQKPRSVGQIMEKPCEHYRCHSFGPIFIKLAQNDHRDNISGQVWIWAMLGQKLGQ